MNTPLMPEEIAAWGDLLYTERIQPLLTYADRNKIVAIDIVTGNFMVDESELVAAQSLQVNYPDAIIWFVRGADPMPASVRARR